jgi:hypothetical protein
VTTRHAPAAPINRTGYASTRRASGWEGNHTDTVASGPSASENADGPGRWQRPGAISRHARVTENVRHDSEVTAVSLQRTRTPPSRDSGTPTPHREAVAS